MPESVNGVRFAIVASSQPGIVERAGARLPVVVNASRNSETMLKRELESELSMLQLAALFMSTHSLPK